MHYVKVVLGVAFGVFVFAFLDYVLPSKNTVRITNTYNRLTAVTPSNGIFYASDNTGTVENASGQRDVRFIDTIRPNGKPFVYRNEDTGWVWPPYFKWDSSTLQAEAANLQSAKSSPQWVAITHYGWRIPFLSAFPNAVKVTPVDGPDVQLIPWLNIVILTFLAFVLFMIRKMWLQFRERMVDPAVDDVSAALDAVDARADAARAEVRGIWGRFMAWLGTWRARR